MEDNKVETDAEKVSFIADGNLINTHLLAVSKDKTRRILHGICFAHNDGALHIVSSDGKILLHSIIPDIEARTDGQKEWEFVVEIPTKLKCGQHAHEILFEVKGDAMELQGSGNGERRILPLEVLGSFPRWEPVETFDGVKPSKYQPFEPKYLSVVKDYVGLNAYAEPVCVRHLRTNAEGEQVVDESPFKFESTDSCGIVRRACLMPIKPKPLA